MPVLKFKRFNKPQILKRIGRGLLVQFLTRFQEELASRGLALPSPELPDAEYFKALAGLLMTPEGLPDRFNEALFAVDEMSTPRWQDLLRAIPEWPDLRPIVPQDSSPEEIALQVWLAAPAVLARTHNAQRLRRLTSFEYAGSKFAEEQRLPFTLPSPVALDALTGALDAWFARNQRGQRTTRIEVYPLEDEFWFLVRHGDTYTRTPKVDQQKTEIIHFRPERDDVIVYSPGRDEIRLNARTKGERDLYIEQFGLHLRGRADYFSDRETYTLEPLRTEGAEALDHTGIEGIHSIVLHELEVDLGNGNQEVITRTASDIFCGVPGMPRPEPVPKRGTLARAIFELHFAGSVRPRPVEVRPPNTLKVGRRCDARLVQRWLTARGFRSSKPAQERTLADKAPS